MNSMDVEEVGAQNALCRSKIPGVEYVIIPGIGCAHGCRTCCAAFMGRWSRLASLFGVKAGTC